MIMSESLSTKHLLFSLGGKISHGVTVLVVQLEVTLASSSIMRLILFHINSIGQAPARASLKYSSTESAISNPV